MSSGRSRAPRDRRAVGGSPGAGTAARRRAAGRRLACRARRRGGSLSSSPRCRRSRRGRCTSTSRPRVEATHLAATRPGRPRAAAAAHDPHRDQRQRGQALHRRGRAALTEPHTSAAASERDPHARGDPTRIGFSRFRGYPRGRCQPGRRGRAPHPAHRERETRGSPPFVMRAAGGP